jgi:hypothetical protein
MRRASVFVALGRSADVAREHRIGGWFRRPAGGARKGRTGATPPWGGWFSAPVGGFAYSAWHHSLTRSTLRVLLRRGGTSRARKPPAASRRKRAAAATRGRSTADRQPDNRMPGRRCRRPSIALLAVPGRLASPCPLQRHHRPRTRPPRPNSSRMRNLFFLLPSRAGQPIQTVAAWALSPQSGTGNRGRARRPVGHLRRGVGPHLLRPRNRALPLRAARRHPDRKRPRAPATPGGKLRGCSGPHRAAADVVAVARPSCPATRPSTPSVAPDVSPSGQAPPDKRPPHRNGHRNRGAPVWWSCLWGGVRPVVP